MCESPKNRRRWNRPIRAGRRLGEPRAAGDPRAVARGFLDRLLERRAKKMPSSSAARKELGSHGTRTDVSVCYEPPRTQPRARLRPTVVYPTTRPPTGCQIAEEAAALTLI